MVRLRADDEQARIDEHATAADAYRRPVFWLDRPDGPPQKLATVALPGKLRALTLQRRHVVLEIIENGRTWRDRITRVVARDGALVPKPPRLVPSVASPP